MAKGDERATQRERTFRTIRNSLGESGEPVKRLVNPKTFPKLAVGSRAEEIKSREAENDVSESVEERSEERVWISAREQQRKGTRLTHQ